MVKRRAPDTSAAAAAEQEQEQFEDPGILADDSSDDIESEELSEGDDDAMHGSDAEEGDGECTNTSSQALQVPTSLLR